MEQGGYYFLLSYQFLQMCHPQALKEARECASRAEVEVETLRRRLDMVGDDPTAGTVNHAGIVREGDLAAMEEENR